MGGRSAARPGWMEGPAAGAAGVGMALAAGQLAARVSTLEIALGGLRERVSDLEGGAIGGGGEGGAQDGGARAAADGREGAQGEEAGPHAHMHALRARAAAHPPAEEPAGSSDASGGSSAQCALDEPAERPSSLREFARVWRASREELEAAWQRRAHEAAERHATRAAELEALREAELRHQQRVEADNADREAMERTFETLLQQQRTRLPVGAESIRVPTAVQHSHRRKSRARQQRQEQRVPAGTRAAYQRREAPPVSMYKTRQPQQSSAAERLAKFRASEARRRAKAMPWMHKAHDECRGRDAAAKAAAATAMAAVEAGAPKAPRAARSKPKARTEARPKSRSTSTAPSGAPAGASAERERRATREECDARYFAALELFERSKALAKENETTAARLQEAAMSFAAKRQQQYEA